MINHYFDHQGYYTGSAETNPGSNPPDNALRIAPPSQIGYWPVLDHTRNGWTLVEDHRGKTGLRDGKPFTIDQLGPLPAGWTELTTPANEIPGAFDKLRLEIFKRLAMIDAESIRPLRAIANNSAVEYDLSRITALDAEAQNLRDELLSLTESNPAMYCLSSTGVYHLPSCTYANANLVSIEQIHAQRPDARPCTKCNPQ